MSTKMVYFEIFSYKICFQRKMTSEEQEYINSVTSKFNELKAIIENPPASLQVKDSSSFSSAKNQIKEAENKLANLRAGALIGKINVILINF